MSLIDQRAADGTVATVSGDRLDAAMTGSAAAPRRWRRRLGFLALLGLLLAAAAWAAPRTVALGADVTPSFGDGSRVVELPQFGDGGSYVLAYEDGAFGTVQLPLRNDRPFPVSIEDVRLTDQPRSLAEVVSVASGSGASLPLRLGAGEQAVFELTVRFDNCAYYHERALERLDRAFVDVAVLGRAGTVAVSLDRPILVRSPMIVDCPDRVLDRQAKTRRGG